MESTKLACPRCSAEYVSWFRCDFCGELFCDLCETKKVINAMEQPLKIQFYCPDCNKTATRISIPARTPDQPAS